MVRVDRIYNLNYALSVEWNRTEKKIDSIFQPSFNYLNWAKRKIENANKRIEKGPEKKSDDDEKQWERQDAN